MRWSWTAPIKTIESKFTPPACSTLEAPIPQHDDLFLGISYANGPRLRNPEPLGGLWTGVRDATHCTVACYADCHSGALGAVRTTVGEDCQNRDAIRLTSAASSSPLSPTTAETGTPANTSYRLRDSDENCAPDKVTGAMCGKGAEELFRRGILWPSIDEDFIGKPSTWQVLEGVTAPIRVQFLECLSG
ncbi:hypothetical protein LX36DRAFT_709928 [Colletotrichum falcatum]|nr:hypothetical protein LX36DRAFT_709928 [Colletotrichum falcatum]